MTLIIGGRGQGKLSYVMEHWSLKETDIAPMLGGQRVVCHLEEIVKELHTAGQEPVSVILEHARTHPDTIYICDEVGCGVVPIERWEREWREDVGRCCVALAAQAECVERVFCGLPMGLKGKQGLT